MRARASGPWAEWDAGAGASGTGFFADEICTRWTGVCCFVVGEDVGSVARRCNRHIFLGPARLTVMVHVSLARRTSTTQARMCERQRCTDATVQGGGRFQNAVALHSHITPTESPNTTQIQRHSPLRVP